MTRTVKEMTQMHRFQSATSYSCGTNPEVNKATDADGEKKKVDVEVIFEKNIEVFQKSEEVPVPVSLYLIENVGFR